MVVASSGFGGAGLGVSGAGGAVALGWAADGAWD